MCFEIKGKDSSFKVYLRHSLKLKHMKKNQLLGTLFCALFIAFMVQSCNKEFVADDDTFADWDGWALVATENGPAPDLGEAHAANDSTVTRKIYFLDDEEAEDSEYPVGTAIFKHTKSEDGALENFLGMVKRGKDFNPDNNDWEWFKLNADGSIIERGENIGMCGTCHASSNATDYVFSK